MKQHGVITQTSVDFVESLTVVPSSEEHEVRPWRFAHKSNLCHIRTCTTVGTASHAHDDRVIAKAVLFTYFFDFVNEHR